MISKEEIQKIATVKKVSIDITEKDKNINLNSLKKTLQKKCDVRSTAFPKIEHIKNHNNRQFVASEWATQLRHQLPSLPLFQDFLSEATKVLEWVNQQ